MKQLWKRSSWFIVVCSSVVVVVCRIDRLFVINSIPEFNNMFCIIE
jgi:hypothetical protein